MPVMSTTEEERAVQARDAALQGAMTYIDRKRDRPAIWTARAPNENDALIF